MKLVETKEKIMQHETSVTHRKKIESGLEVKWVRTTGDTDRDWSVVCYSDGSRWFYDNTSSEELMLLGTVSDGNNKSEILTDTIGAIFALYESEPQSFSDSETWVSSLSDADKKEAEALLSRGNTLDRLYDLPDSEFELGGEFDALARANGYSSGKAAANELNLWDYSPAEAKAALSAN